MKRLSLILLVIAASLSARGQSDTNNVLAGGKWMVCADTAFSKDYDCNKGYTSYEFFENGTYKENRQAVYGGKKYSYLSGKWKLNGNSLTIDEDDDQYHKVHARIYDIIWLDNDRFYKTGHEGPGGPIVYTYFHRTK